MGGYKSWPDTWPGPETIQGVPGSAHFGPVEFGGKQIPRQKIPRQKKDPAHLTFVEIIISRNARKKPATSKWSAI
jgi:hypothetical protein